MTNEDRQRLRALAEKATPGPWHAEPFSRSGDKPPQFRGRVFFLGHPNPRTNTRDCDLTLADARYIAAANPQVVLDLLDELENDTCARHAGQTHGAEAEELRSGIEALLEDPPGGDIESNKEWRAAIVRMLDDIDARDSLAYLESRDQQLAAAQQEIERLWFVNGQASARIEELESFERDARLEIGRLQRSYGSTTELWRERTLEQQLQAVLAAKDEACDLAERFTLPPQIGEGASREYAARISAIRAIGKGGSDGE